MKGLGVAFFKFIETIPKIKKYHVMVQIAPNQRKNTMWRFHKQKIKRYNCDIKLMWESYQCRM